MPKRVLVVDDDPAQRRILEETITRFGYHVETAEGGDAALAALKADTAGDICLMWVASETGLYRFDGVRFTRPLLTGDDTALAPCAAAASRAASPTTGRLARPR